MRPGILPGGVARKRVQRVTYNDRGEEVTETVFEDEPGGAGVDDAAAAAQVDATPALPLVLDMQAPLLITCMHAAVQPTTRLHVHRRLSR